MAVAKRVMEVFDGIGMFCVEMFITQDMEVLVNEVAPRPHNSGHYTIEGCVTSQFANHIRAITGLPLGSTTLLSPTVMINLLGAEGYEGDAYVKGLYDALKIKNTHVHIYGKKNHKA
jgi:5-(carboxyamino)imidazole ribonucleotide synthase